MPTPSTTFTSAQQVTVTPVYKDVDEVEVPISALFSTPVHTLMDDFNVNPGGDKGVVSFTSNSDGTATVKGLTAGFQNFKISAVPASGHSPITILYTVTVTEAGPQLAVSVEVTFSTPVPKV